MSQGKARTLLLAAECHGDDGSEGLAEDVLARNEDRTFSGLLTAYRRVESRPTSLIKRFASPDEVASLVTYIASPLASATAGAALRVDGGAVKSAF